MKPSENKITSAECLTLAYKFELIQDQQLAAILRDIARKKFLNEIDNNSMKNEELELNGVIL